MQSHGIPTLNDDETELILTPLRTQLLEGLGQNDRRISRNFLQVLKTNWHVANHSFTVKASRALQRRIKLEVDY